jgi:hypothetical protein
VVSYKDRNGVWASPSWMIARVRLWWLGEVCQMSAIGTEEMFDSTGQEVGLLG